jgi:DNA-binding MarR family transcriptional regulator
MIANATVFLYDALVAASPLSDTELDAWRSLLRAHAGLLEVLERELEAEHGMSLGFYEVLVRLSDAGGRLRMSDLANGVFLSRSGLTRLIDRMVSAGLVDRETCPSDRRGAYAVLTQTGRKALNAAWHAHARGVAEHFAHHLAPGEAKLLADILGRVADAHGVFGGACDGAVPAKG